MKKRIVAIMVMLTLMLGSTMTVFAAPKTMPDGTIFDAEFYASQNPDVVKAFGTKESSLYNHYKKYGRAEGRLAYAQVTGEAIQPTGSISDQVKALGITYDPSKDATLFDSLMLTKDSCLIQYTDMSAEYPTHVPVEPVRADYTNDPLYLEFAKELMRLHDARLQLLYAGDERAAVEAGATDIRDYVNGLYFGNADKAYLYQLLFNLSVDYYESILGTDVTWMQMIVGIHTDQPFGTKVSPAYKRRVDLFANPSMKVEFQYR